MLQRTSSSKRQARLQSACQPLPRQQTGGRSQPRGEQTPAGSSTASLPGTGLHLQVPAEPLPPRPCFSPGSCGTEGCAEHPRHKPWRRAPSSGHWEGAGSPAAATGCTLGVGGTRRGGEPGWNDPGAAGGKQHRPRACAHRMLPRWIRDGFASEAVGSSTVLPSGSKIKSKFGCWTVNPQALVHPALRCWLHGLPRVHLGQAALYRDGDPCSDLQTLSEKAQGKGIRCFGLAVCARGRQPSSRVCKARAGPGTPSCPAWQWLGGRTAACRSPQQAREQRKSCLNEASGCPRCQMCVPPHSPPPPAQHYVSSGQGRPCTALLDVPPVPSPLLPSAGSKAGAKSAAVQASALGKYFIA